MKEIECVNTEIITNQDALRLKINNWEGSLKMYALDLIEGNTVFLVGGASNNLLNNESNASGRYTLRFDREGFEEFADKVQEMREEIFDDSDKFKED